MGLAASLMTLRAALDQTRLPLDLPDSKQAASISRQIVAQLDDYVLPRLVNLEAPLLAVVGGSTGAGKSTLVNSLIGRVISPPGVIRPTTLSPVLVSNPADEHWFTDARVLPGLIRARVASQDQRSLQLVSEPTLPRGLAILDAPDIDSVVAQNRILAAQLLDAADLWLFVTSAARYADAVPWEFLQIAADRGASIAVVVDRVPPGAMGVVPADLGRMMTERGLADAPLFAVPETIVDDLGLLPDAAVAPIRTYLATLAADKDARERVVRRTLDGAIASLAERAPGVAAAVDSQVAVSDQLFSDAQRAFAEAARAVAVQSADGTLLRGEVLSRWHDYVGTGELMRSLDQKVSRLRDRLVGFFSGHSQLGEQVGVAAGSGLEALIRAEGEAAVERAVSAWQGNPAGRQLLAQHPELGRPSGDFPATVARTIRDWQSDVLALVSSEGSSKRAGARIAALSVNGVGAALMLVIFFNTGGITGAEGGVAVGTTVLAQRLLESVFGDEAVRRLAESAKSDLDARVEGLMASEFVRFSRIIDQLPVDREDAEAIRQALADVSRERAVLPSAGSDASAGRQGTPELNAGASRAELTEAGVAHVDLTPVRDTGDAEVVEAELLPDDQWAGR